MSEDSVWYEIVREIAKKEGLKHPQFHSNSGSDKGDNYLGTITKVEVTDTSTNKSLNLIAKMAFPDPKIREVTPIKHAYSREVYVYDTILKLFRDFQVEKNISRPFTGYAKLYGTSLIDGKELLILEDLKSKGYEMWNRKIPMTSDHLSLVFEEYAKLHAVSFAMRKLQPEKYEKLTENLTDIFESFYEKSKNIFEQSKRDAMDAVKENPTAKAAMERYHSCLDNILDDFVKTEGNLSVVTHGDCWCNNMLFFVEDCRPMKVCLIDWQISRKGPFVYDLAYFFCSCAGNEDLYQYEKYLKIYHETLSGNLREFGCDPEEFLTFTTLMDEWNKCAKYGLFMASLLFKITLADKSDVVDLMDMAKMDTGIEAIFNGTQTTSAEYKKRIMDLVLFMSSSNLV